jgi:geranylgeranyl reductase family protein
MKYDVIVVGAGPAGSAAARLLAEQGVRVALLERTKMPRYKACGAGIVGRAMRVLPPDVKETVERECFTVELHMLDAGLHFTVTRHEPVVFMSMRDKLDRLLAVGAQKAGADLWEECNVLDVALGAGSVTVETNRGFLSASFVIAADGSTSSIAKKAGWRETQRLVPAIEWEVPVDKEIFEKFANSARFDFGPVPSGYAWVFPKGSHLSVGAATMKRGSVGLTGLLEKHLWSLGIPLNNGVVRHGALVSSRPRSDDLVKGRVLLAGDAAGLADPVTGEGISFAVVSGQAAARALVAGDFTETAVKEAYLKAIEEKILKELRPAMDLGKLLYGPAAIRNHLFRLKGQAVCEAVTDVIAGKKNYSELASKVPAYARRLLIPDFTRIFSRQDSG